MLVTTLDQNDLIWLAFAAGIAAGSGNTAANVALTGILQRVMEVDDQDIELPTDDDPELDDGWVPVVEEPREIDPKFVPPAPAPPSHHSTQFGSGPIQGELA